MKGLSSFLVQYHSGLLPLSSSILTSMSGTKLYPEALALTNNFYFEQISNFLCFKSSFIFFGFTNFISFGFLYFWFFIVSKLFFLFVCTFPYAITFYNYSFTSCSSIFDIVFIFGDTIVYSVSIPILLYYCSVFILNFFKSGLV